MVAAADLFCGCGGLTLGLAEACRIIGHRLAPVFAVDADGIAIIARFADLSRSLH
jgi:DNA (cytosine-5)-methyltransferase 1